MHYTHAVTFGFGVAMVGTNKQTDILWPQTFNTLPFFSGIKKNLNRDDKTSLCYREKRSAIRER